jgi:hypothetical protein
MLGVSTLKSEKAMKKKTQERIVCILPLDMSGLSNLKSENAKKAKKLERIVLLTSIGHVRLVWELDADLVDSRDLADVGPLGAHDCAMILLWNDALHSHLSFLQPHDHKYTTQNKAKDHPHRFHKWHG